MYNENGNQLKMTFRIHLEYLIRMYTQDKIINEFKIFLFTAGAGIRPWKKNSNYSVREKKKHIVKWE